MKKPATEPTVTKKTLRLVDKLDATAQVWGWASDQGGETDAKKAETAYANARSALLHHLHQLEQKK